LLDPTMRGFLDGAPGLLVGVVATDGTPCVARAWGLSVLNLDPPPRARLLVPADDSTLLGLLGEGARVAVTSGNVRTYRSLQLKGRSLGVDEPTDEDHAGAQRYIDAFFAELLDINGMPRELCDRFLPAEFAACTLTIDDLYDQTPGPGAGAALTTSA
jgi:hypothetical protein